MRRQSAFSHADSYVNQTATGSRPTRKTAAILHQLRGLLGDEVFFAAFRRYAARLGIQASVPVRLLPHVLENAAGIDLEPYFRTWFFEAWKLDHAVAGVENDNGKAVVKIEDRGRAIHPCWVEVTLEGGKVERRLVDAAHWQNGRSAEFEFDGRVTKVVLDPDVETLDADRRNNEWEGEDK